MYKFLLILCFWGISSLLSFSQSKVTDYRSKTEKIKFDKDTVWLINTEYDLYHQKLELKLDFSEQIPVPREIKWEAGSGWQNVDAGGMTHWYESGLHELQLKAADGKIYYYMVFNKMLTADFELTPDPFQFCLEKGGDSLLLVKKNFDQNMPETKYEIVIDGPDVFEEGVQEPFETSEWFNDSAWIVFKHETGVNPCNIYLRMTYTDEEKNISLSEETNPQKISVYRAPNVKEIFGFKQEEEGEEITNVEVCTGKEQSFVKLDEKKLKYYQYKKGSLAPVPSYDSYLKAKDMEIHYFYSDTLYDGMPESNWKDVSGTDMVSTTSEILFFVPGFYKMMMTAKNMCNEVGEIKIDTLWTHETGQEKKRYFQVYSNDSTKLVCKTERLCRNISDTIVIVDYNVRRGFEKPPVYTFTASEYIMDNSSASTSIAIWKSGRIVTGDDAEYGGCDSTVIRIHLNDKNFYGELNLNVERKSACSGGGREFKIFVGREPNIRINALYKELYDDYKVLFDGTYYNHCDTFLYRLPVDSLTLPTWERGFSLDSIGFYIKQGSAGEKSLVYYPESENPYFWLDSTDVASYVRIRSYNVCGVKEDTLKNLRVNARPKVKLLRDSLLLNDSLCIGMDYPYYWGGKLPKEYEIYLRSSGDVYVNNTLQTGGIQFQIGNGDMVRHIQAGVVEEHFLVQNKNMLSCALDSSWKVVVLAQPDTLLHPDSVGYCLGSPELQTVKLFAPGKSDFKWGEWKLNDGEVQKEKLPEFTLTGQVDTLRYKLSRSKGCYIGGELLLRPQTVPVLELADYGQYCLPYTIHAYRQETFVNAISDWNGYNRLTVYADIIDEAKSYYKELYGPYEVKYPLLQEDNGKKFIYEMVNVRVDTALLGKCRVLDTVQLKISSPKLEVLKSDELKYPWDAYDFAHLKDNGFIDTAYLNAATLKWTLRPGDTPCGTGLYGGSYTLTKEDKAKDTLMFELSAESYCGRVLKDTLFVELNHLKIKGYKDTICSNEEGYALWDKVQWSHVDESSILWKILYPAVAPGELTANHGSDVKYKPGDGADSVRIWFEAALEDVSTVTMCDTIVLRINPAPILEFTKDTLWACGRSVILKDIPEAYLYKSKTTGIRRGDYVYEPGQNSPIGGWIDGDLGNYSFASANIENAAGDLFQKVSYEALGLPGCKSVFDTVVLAQPVPAKITFKRKYEEMCAGDRMKLDTLYTLSGEDPFVRYEWTVANDVLGQVENGYYLAYQPEDKIQQLNVSTHKEYTCYTGKPSGKALQTAVASLPLTVHREPVFNVVHRYDTLCRNTSEIHINRDWVNVEKNLYPDYQDSIRVNGVRLLNAGIPYSVNNEDSREKLVVTVSQGRCSKWHKSDTIYLYRLGSMFNGTFSVPDVCEGGQVLIDKSNLSISPLSSSPNWSATGGTVTYDGNDRYFVPKLGVDRAYISLSVDAPHGCGTEWLPEVYVAVGRRPRLQTKAYTVCRVAGHTQQIATAMTDPTVQVQKIDWFRCGTPDEHIVTTGPDEPEWTFTVSDADMLKTEVCLRAVIQSVGACQGSFEDTVRIRWQEKPSFSVQPVEICQADPAGVDLQTKVQVTNAGVVTWNLKTSDAGTMSGTSFMPGEYSGPAIVEVTAPGLLGCPDEVRQVTVDVKAAPRSGILPQGEHCTQRQVMLKPGSNRTTNYSWEFGDGGQASNGNQPVYHEYRTEGDYTIILKAQFDNGCLRQETLNWSVHPTPLAMFDLPFYSPIDKPVALTNASSPKTVSSHWTVDQVSDYTDTDAVHIFTVAGPHQVRLVVTSTEGCTDTIVKSTEVLGVPVARFDVEVDSCAGKVNIVNRSVRNEATVAWDFGNGESVSSTWEPSERSYPLVWQDTSYTIRLTLANVSDTVQYERTFKMVSKLAPDFEIWTSNPCNKTKKEIRILTRGRTDMTYLDWGDGSAPEQWVASNPVNVLGHTYPENQTTAPVDYRIKLRSVNTCHRPAPVEKGVSIVPLEVKVKLLEAEELPEYANPCYGNDRGFWNKSFGFISRGYTCEWDFGDGSPLQSDTVSTKPKAHMFARPGEYTVRLRVKDECNEMQDSLTVIAHGNDSLSFAFDKDKERLCTGDSVRIYFVQWGKEPFTNLRWTLPDGSHETNADTVYWKFKEAGKWEVSLSAVADGCPENPRTQRCLVQQTPEPMIDISAGVETEGCTPLRVPFRVANNKGGTNDVLTFWDFGEGSTSTEVIPPAMVFDSAGRYMVKVSMTSSNGCVGWDSVPVTARITPATMFELEQHLVCSNDGNFEIVAFNRTSSPDSCTFEWYKGNEVVSMDPVSVTIPFTGFHGKEGIALRAVHRRTQCSYRMNDTIVASLPVKAGLSVSPDTVCSGMEVVFTDTSTMAGVTRRFLFDDGSFAEEREVGKTYWEPGKYAYEFVLTNADGCTDTIRDNVFVHSLPWVEFDWKKDNMITGVEIVPDPEVESGGVRFTNRSVIHLQEWEKEGLRYHWDFGDGETSEEKEPGHQYDNNGSYEVWLHAVSKAGCRDSVSRLIDIATIKGLYFPNAMAPASGDPGVNRFQPKGVGLSGFTLKVYAPDGTCVWQTDKLDNGRPAEYWDGTFNGQPVRAGVYVWEASAVFIDGTVQNHLNGSLIVIR